MKYRQMTVSEALRLYPALADILPRSVLADPRYVVRVSPRGIEFGYPSDDWVIA